MLHEFLVANRETLIRRCTAKVAKRSAPRATEPELEFGIPFFLEQLTRRLRYEQQASSQPSGRARGETDPDRSAAPSEIGVGAASHGEELLHHGFTVDQVVHDYGDLCQAITELAVEQDADITADEFRTLNMCLDNAIAAAVTGYGRRRDEITSDRDSAVSNERLGFLAHELRNLLNAVMLAVAAMKAGNVGLSGATAGVLDRNLIGMRDLIDRSLAEVRLAAGIHRRERISMFSFIEDVQVSAVMDAQAKGVSLTVSPVPPDLWVDADPHTLSSAVMNLLQNGFKFTRLHGHVWLSARGTAERVLIEVEDQCGGLADGIAEVLFRPFEQRDADRTGLGLGLAISRAAVEANNGAISVRSRPGSGCVFTIDLPRASPPEG